MNGQNINSVIMEADEESYYQNDSPVRGRKPLLIGNTQTAEQNRGGFSQSPPSNKNAI